MVVITHQELTTGQQAVQSAHAVIGYTYRYKIKSAIWHIFSKNLVFLTVKTKQDLDKLIETLRKKKVKIYKFKEPDLNNQITAVSLIQTNKSYQITKKLKLL